MHWQVKKTIKNLLFASWQSWIFLLLSIFILGSCATAKDTSSTKKRSGSVKKIIQKSPVFNKSFTGFALYDPEEKKMLFEQDADKYFTPASNTKIFTLYTALRTLGDSIPALKYHVREDSLFFYGTGDPTLLNPYFTDNQRIIHFLKNQKKKLFFCPGNFMDERFGAGWAWDDYAYGYQIEKSSFPIFGNTVFLKNKSGSSTIETTPPFFRQKLILNPTLRGSKFRIKRREHANIFEYNHQQLPPDGFERTVAFHYSDELLIQLLSEVLEKEIFLANSNFIFPKNTKTIYSAPTDEMYQEMMQESDNFLAEQILLLCASEIFDTLNTRKIIDFAIKNYLNDLPDKPIWRDGSGLSRYNLFTPRSIIRLLEKIQQLIPEDRIFKIFPRGKESGTIKNWYGPYVFAKTGTLSNKHCLSGYIKTKKGKTLIFSFMHNNYITGSTPLKEEMEKILQLIHEKY